MWSPKPAGPSLDWIVASTELIDSLEAAGHSLVLRQERRGFGESSRLVNFIACATCGKTTEKGKLSPSDNCPQNYADSISSAQFRLPGLSLKNLRLEWTPIREKWADIADGLGLNLSSSLVPMLVGEIDSIKVAAIPGFVKLPGIVAELPPGPWDDHKMFVRRNKSPARRRKLTTGDPAFDQRFKIVPGWFAGRSSRSWIKHFLDPDRRRALLDCQDQASDIELRTGWKEDAYDELRTSLKGQVSSRLLLRFSGGVHGPRFVNDVNAMVVCARKLATAR